MSRLSVDGGGLSLCTWLLSVSLVRLVGCAGRPNFQGPSCEVGDDACLDLCEDTCKTERQDGESEVMVDCAKCTGRCADAARTYEATVD